MEWLKKTGSFLWRYKKRIIEALIALLLLLICIVAGYIVPIKDATLDLGNAKNTPYVVKKNSDSVTIADDGTISSEKSAQELWDEMQNNKNTGLRYLDSASELKKLMNASLVSKYPDTREDPDKEIDWNSDELTDVNSKKIQGIIKFKRSDADGKVSTLSYVDEDTYYGWIEDYSQSGSSEAEKNLRTHFTLQQAESVTSDGKDTNTYDNVDTMTDISQAIVDASYRTISPGAGLCQKWVREVYVAAGLPNKSYGTAYEAYLANAVSTRRDNIPIGAAVYGTGSGSYAGHVGIYIGNGKVRDNVGSIKEQTLDEWIAWQERRGGKKRNIDGKMVSGYLGWGWQSGKPKTTSSSSSSGDASAQSNSQSGSEGSLKDLLVIGDSISVGLESKFYDAGAAKVIDKSGKTASYFLDKFDSEIGNLSIKPSGILLILGQNSCSNSQYRKNGYQDLELLIDKLKSKFPKTTIYINSILPVDTGSTINVGGGNFSGSKYMERQKELNKDIKNLCDTSSNMAYIDSLDGYAESNGYAKQSLCGDGLHPNSKGYEKIFNNIKNQIESSGDEFNDDEDEENENKDTSSETQYYAVVASFNSTETVETTAIDGTQTSSNTSSSYGASPVQIDYRSMTSGFDMPFEYLWTFLVLGREFDLVSELADLVYNSKIEITVYDNLQVDVDTTIDDYDVTTRTEEKKKKDNGTIETTTKTETHHHTNTTKVTTTTNTVDAELTLADVWIEKYTKKFTRQVDDPKETSSTKEVPGTGSYMGTSTSNHTITTKHDPYSTVYTGSPEEIQEKTDKNASEPNFVSIFCQQDNHFVKYRIVEDVPSWVFKILAKNDSTKDMVDLTKYLFYKISGTNFGVTEFDFKEYTEGSMSDVTGVYGDYVVKTDASGAAEAVDKAKMEQGLKKWLKSYSDMKNNALSVLDTVMENQDKYKVNGVFVYAFLRIETRIGTADTNYVNVDNNWGSWNLGHKFSSPQENVSTIMRLMATGNIYFKKGKISVSQIGATYCPNDAKHPHQGDDWIKTVNGYMTDLYSAMGIKAKTRGGQNIVTGGKGTNGIFTSSHGEKFNLYLQGSGAPWADHDYGNSGSMAKAGCGPTAAAIIASSYDSSITPDTVRAALIRKYGRGNHSSASCIKTVLNELMPGVKMETTSTFDVDKARKCLKNGGKVWMVGVRSQGCYLAANRHCLAIIDYNNSDEGFVAHGSSKRSGRNNQWVKLSTLKKWNGSAVLYVGGK